MEPLPRLKARITSLRELQELIGALRALAASHVQEAQSALAAIRRYAVEVEDAIASGATLLAPPDGRAPPPDDADAAALLVVCSEHGFVGGFNERLLEHVEAVRRADQALVIVGRRGAMLADERGLKARWRFPMATHVGGVPSIARRVADRLVDVQEADAVFASYRRGGDVVVETKTILPLDPALLARAEERSPPLHHLGADLLLEQLAGEYLFAQIMHAITESLTSENGARLRVMEAADQNIGDKLDGLRATEHTLRQEAITSELLDVVTGAEAILGGQGR